MESPTQFILRKADLILTVIVLAVVASATFYTMKRMGSKQNRAECQGRLWGVAKAFQEFALAHQDAFPMGLSTNLGGTREWNQDHTATYRHFNAIAKSLPGPDFLVCPQDTRAALGGLTQDYQTLRRGWELVSNSNLSYFVNLDATIKSETMLAGDRNVATNSMLLKVARGQKIRWIPEMGLHGRTGNAAFSDGHVEVLDFEKLNQKAAPARLSIP